MWRYRLRARDRQSTQCVVSVALWTQSAESTDLCITRLRVEELNNPNCFILPFKMPLEIKYAYFIILKTSWIWKLINKNK